MGSLSRAVGSLLLLRLTLCSILLAFLFVISPPLSASISLGIPVLSVGNVVGVAVAVAVPCTRTATDRSDGLAGSQQCRSCGGHVCLSCLCPWRQCLCFQRCNCFWLYLSFVQFGFVVKGFMIKKGADANELSLVAAT